MRQVFRFILILSVLFPMFGKAQFYYGLQQDFGKNRVQYQPFNWTYFGFDRYQVYLYEGGQEVAKYVAKRAEIHLKDIERKLDFESEEKLQIMVYTNQGDYRQSNLGLSGEENGNLGGVTKIVGSKLSVYFTGNHADLDRQIRAGIAEVLVNDMMYGGRTRDMVKNSTLLVVPDWFRSGLISYLSESWSVDLDNMVMDGIVNDRYYNFNKLSGYEATVAGHALWSYVADTYGEAVIPNILYMSKVSRNVESAFTFVIGSNVRNLTYEWIDAFARRNMGSDTSQYLPKTDPLLANPRSGRNYYQLKINPNGKKVAYVTNELSQYKVWLKDLSDENKKPKRIMKWGPKIERINDLSYPLLAWHPMGSALAMINEKKGVIYLTTYQVNSKEKSSRPITGIEKVIDFAYSPDGKRIVFSGVKKGKGQADIFVFTINAGGLEQITNDVWDDNYPRFVNKGNHIVFSSNRVNDTIKDSDNAKYMYEQSKLHDIFMYDFKSKSKNLMRVTATPAIHETQPADYEEGYFSYLSESNGIRNRFVAKLDSVISYVDTSEHYRYTFYPKVATNYQRNVLEHDIAFKGKKIAEVFYENGKQYMYVSDLQKVEAIKPISLSNTYYRRSLLYAPKQTTTTTATAPLTPAEKNETHIGVNIDDYSFNNAPPKVNQEEHSRQDTVTRPNSDTNHVRKKEFSLPIQRNYYTNFSVDNVVTQFDNSFLNQSYQRFTGYYINPGMNGFFKISMSDLFEDYRIVGGVRISGNLNNEYFVSIENRRKLIDKQLILRFPLPST
ncbi:MAG: TolB family protein, partial [Bacteroidia bacterium]